MKLIDDNMEQSSVSGFNFSAVRVETLGATEYTLATVVVDKTGSVSPFAQQLYDVVKSVVGACRKSARAEYLLLRVLEFNSTFTEVHGFKPLSEINENDYVVPACTGMTALADATFSAISATNAFAKTLADQNYQVNGIFIVVTDGDDNASKMRTSDIKREMDTAIRGEHIESIRSILVGINAADYAATLQNFQQEAGLDQYVDVADATPQRLAKLAAFVSQSISAQSQSLGTGGPSQALVF